MRDWYNWPRMYQDVEQYVKQCSVCTQNEGHQNTATGAIHPLPVPKGPWQDISIDLIIGLLVVQGFDGVCMVVDCFFKEIMVFPVTSKILAGELVAKFRDKIWWKHRLPDSVLSDCEPQFMS